MRNGKEMCKDKKCLCSGADSKGQKRFLLDVFDDTVISFEVCSYIHLFLSVHNSPFLEIGKI